MWHALRMNWQGVELQIRPPIQNNVDRLHKEGCTEPKLYPVVRNLYDNDRDSVCGKHQKLPIQKFPCRLANGSQVCTLISLVDHYT